MAEIGRRPAQDGYTELMHQHFLAPQNAGVLDAPDASGQARASEDGDLLTLQLAIADDVITDARFQAFGCAAAIAAGSMLTTLLIGRTLAEAREIDDAAVAHALGGVPERKQHCSLLASDVLADALSSYPGDD